jgi:hypothetical protein
MKELPSLMPLRYRARQKKQAGEFAGCFGFCVAAVRRARRQFKACRIREGPRASGLARATDAAKTANKAASKKRP